MLRTVAAAAAVVAVSEAACNPPAPGSALTIQTCATGASKWSFSGTSGLGSFSLVSNSNLCLSSQGPIYQPSGAPQIVLAQCNSSDPSQMWAWGILPGPTQIYNGLSGEVMDTFNNEYTPGTIVETYSPNGGANQAYTWVTKSSGGLRGGISVGEIITSLDNSSCLSIC
jgi:hypothetical protein